MRDKNIRNLCRALLMFSFLCFFSLSVYAEEQYSIIDLGTLGEHGSGAFDINNASQIVGWSDIPGAEGNLFHAFLWENGVMTDLGTLGRESIAYGINNSGQIAGRSTPYGFSHHFSGIKER